MPGYGTGKGVQARGNCPTECIRGSNASYPSHAPALRTCRQQGRGPYKSWVDCSAPLGLALQTYGYAHRCEGVLLRPIETFNSHP